ncbi:hypothetical protein FHETE_7951 [Fusarium heterosporum]|uniref:Uncharacterized protein n=1 Tax=Fusarium heterosporum TaxID=42747 RepID=A0A8H5T3L8_FUSHE|nr:hypothetical protein FHETE_7951 [Fusarium heterosporum]
MWYSTNASKAKGQSNDGIPFDPWYGYRAKGSQEDLTVKFEGSKKVVQNAGRICTEAAQAFLSSHHILWHLKDKL